MGRSPKKQQWGRRKVPGAVRVKTYKLAASPHSQPESNNKDDPKLINRTRAKTVKKKGKSHSFSERGGELSKDTDFRL